MKMLNLAAAALLAATIGPTFLGSVESVSLGEDSSPIHSSGNASAPAGTPVDDSEARAFAEREGATPAVEQFEAGDYVYISGAAILLIIIILILI